MSTPTTYLAIDGSGATPGTIGTILYSGTSHADAARRAARRRMMFKDPANAPVEVYELKRASR